MSMDLNHLALLATACAAACLGLVVYLRASDRPANQLYALHSAAMTIWALLTYLVMASTDEVEVVGLLRAMHLVAPFVLATLLDFVWVFPERLTFAPRRRRLLLYGSCVVFAAIAATPALIRYVKVTPTTPLVDFGWPLALLGLWAFPMIVYVNYLLWHKARTLGGLARVQIIYVLAGTLACEAAVTILDMVMPILTGTTTFSRWGVVSYLITAAAIALAIAKYRLWELGGLARRTAALALAIASVTAPVCLAVRMLLGSIPLKSDLGGLAVLAVCLGAAGGLMIRPLADAYGGLFSRALQLERDRIARLLSSLGQAIVHAPLAETALQPMLDAARVFFGADRVEAYLRSPKGLYHSAGGVYADSGTGPMDQQPVHLPLPVAVARTLEADKLSDILEAGQLVRFGAMAEAVAKLGAMEALGANVLVPLRWEDENIGLLVLGPKLSRGMYSSLDLDLLRSVAAHAAIAVKNAELRAQIIAEMERNE